MKKIILFITLLVCLGCSYKTVMHKYPVLYNGDPDKAIDLLELYWLNNYIFEDKNAGVKQSLFYTDGTLYVSNDSLGNIIWSKEDYFITPYSGEEYAIKATAIYYTETNEEGFSIEIFDVKSDSLVSYIDGFKENASIFFDDIDFQITELGFSDSRVIPVNGKNGKVFHYYPEGGVYALKMNDILIGGIIQGKIDGYELNEDNSYIFDLEAELSQTSKSKLITALLAYLALTDIEFYFYECDPYDVNNTICPNTIIIE